MVKTIISCVCICLVAVIIVVTLASYSVSVASSRLIPIYSVDTTSSVASISFDAAWGADKTLDILDLCDLYNIKATFFLVGFWIEQYPELVAEIDARGHEIGTHSVTHPDMTTLSTADMNAELADSISAITAITGKSVTLFRAPFGAYDNSVIECAASYGLYTIQWSIDSLDWQGLSAVEIASRVQTATAGDVILCHNNSDNIVEALPLIFASMDAKGIQLVPIGQLIYLDNYTIDNNGTQHSNI